MTEQTQAAAAPARLKQNGVTRPLDNSMTGKLWMIADRESQKIGAPASRKTVVDAYLSEVAGSVLPTGNTQYARWVKYHGISDQVKQARKAERTAEQAAADAEKQAKIAAKEAEKQAKEDAKAAKEAEKAAAKAAKEQEKAAKAAAKQAEKEAKAKSDKEKADAEAAAAAQAQAEGSGVVAQ